MSKNEEESGQTGDQSVNESLLSDQPPGYNAQQGKFPTRMNKHLNFMIVI